MTDDDDGEEKTYVFTGVATVSVECAIEATSEKEARRMLKGGDCIWTCEDVDGDMREVELVSVG